MFYKTVPKLHISMKITILFFSVILGFSTYAQQFTIPAEEYPFFDIVEWKGTGSLLLNRDPSGLKKKINVTMVGEKPTSTWQESFNPNTDAYYFISNENARYVYFLDQLELTGGKLSFHQINSAGNFKSSSADIGNSIKKLGKYDYTEMKLIDVVTTDKSLLFVLRWNDKKEKKYIDFLVAMTHNNMLLYSNILGEVSEENLKDTRYGYWNYCGFQGENCYFVTKDVQDKKAGWSMRTTNSRGETTTTSFIPAPSFSLETSLVAPFGMTGKYHLGLSDTQSGTILRNNDNFYLTGIQSSSAGRFLEMYLLKAGKWEKVQSLPLAAENSKKLEKFSVFSMNEGLAVTLGAFDYFLPIDVSKKVVKNTHSKLTPNNPSRVMHDSSSDRFTVSLATSVLLFDVNQLKKPTSVNFELIKK